MAAKLKSSWLNAVEENSRLKVIVAILVRMGCLRRFKWR
jgi:hypothetical protein